MAKNVMVMSALYYPPAYVSGAWRLDETLLGSETDIERYAEMAQLCERGRFDLFFIADGLGARTDNLDIWSRQPVSSLNQLEPMTLLAALARSTKHIGLGGTVSTSFFEPFNIARQFASLDHISHGRAAWNVVTSSGDYAAQNFGLEKLPPHDERYEKARESLALVKAYWDTWDDDAFVYDKARGIYFDPKKFHPVTFKGKHFSAYGGMNVARSPQGHPLIVQAGASEAGREFAAESADLVFAGADRKTAKDFYVDLKGRMPKFGRNPDQLKVLTGLHLVVGDTEEAARAKRDEIESLVPIESRVLMVGQALDVNLSDLPLDEPIPEERIPRSANGAQTVFARYADLVRKGMTLREIAHARRGSPIFTGTPASVAEYMEDWFQSGASDGFMINFTYTPGNVVDVVEKVVPILQKRGLMRTEYSGRTLRENLGLPRPHDRRNLNCGPAQIARESASLEA